MLLDSDCVFVRRRFLQREGKLFSVFNSRSVFRGGTRLGGVHRGGETSAFFGISLDVSFADVCTVLLSPALDVSADLQELTRCPVGLVSSGVKSILDIKRTLEYLVSRLSPKPEHAS